MNRPKIPLPPPHNAESSPALRPENNLTAREEAIVAIRNRFRLIAAKAHAASIYIAIEGGAATVTKAAIEGIEGEIREIEKLRRLL